jgi:uncharacterized membrane protein SirB2
MPIFLPTASQAGFPGSFEDGIAGYLALRNIHVAAVSVTLLLFLLRGYWMMSGSRLLTSRFSRIVPHVVDTVLLASAIGLTIFVHQYPLVNSWLTAKVVGLIVYIGLGTVALKRGSTAAIRSSAFVGALIVFAWIVATAIGHSPFLGTSDLGNL